ncbi:hypothetical protein [Frondihabitans peucedani]|uniref:Secreted protein n=1 Tax=Frondihabitans peucedani TaxID=598626 RepID=A0ABP8DXZ8_9MICO
MIALIVLAVLIFAIGLVIGIAIGRRRGGHDDETTSTPDDLLRADSRQAEREDVARGRGANTGLNF